MIFVLSRVWWPIKNGPNTLGCRHQFYLINNRFMSNYLYGFRDKDCLFHLKNGWFIAEMCMTWPCWTEWPPVVFHLRVFDPVEQEIGRVKFDLPCLMTSAPRPRCWRWTSNQVHIPLHIVTLMDISLWSSHCSWTSLIYVSLGRDREGPS